VIYVRESKEANETEGSSVSVCGSISVGWNPMAGRAWGGHCSVDERSGMVLRRAGCESVGKPMIREGLGWCCYCHGVY